MNNPKPPQPEGVAAAPAAAAPADGREAQLLAIARRLFAQKGFDATALRDIAEAAQITKAALYYYFPNKDALYERVVIESMDALLADVQAAVARAPTPTEKVRAFLHASADSMEERRDQWVAGSNAFWQAGATGRRGLALRQRDDYEKLLRACIESGIACGELRPVNPALAGRLLLSGLNQMSRWHRPGGLLRAREVIDQYLDIVLLGLLNRAAPAAAATNR
ncbi:MAG: TetR family transcriptional regulator [Burkholderiales bacterium]|nr:TetR family transcriptional regulator [Burkholderiales bacterium]MDE2394033.1 TetR family transcriptional regulator [Burkholderiales bacterium]MDE2456123.1 TetR family transcriptional regulator [Burkholderiales bacterium]